MKKLPPPIPPSTFLTITLPWLHSLKRHEGISIFLMSKRDQLYRVTQFISYKEFTALKMVPVVIDLLSPLIEDEADFNRLVDTSKKTALFLLNSDILLSEKKHLLSYFESLFLKKNISLLFFFRTYLLTNKFCDILSNYPFLIQNTSLFQVFSTSDSLHFINYLEKKFEISIPEKIKNLIVTRCGGMLWLIKEAVREYSKKKITDVFEHAAMKFRLQTLYKELYLEEKLTLKNLFLSLPLSVEQENIMDYLVKSGAVIIKDNKYIHASPLFQDYFLSQIRLESTLCTNEKNQIHIQDVDISYIFSRLERKLLSYLINNRGVTVSRNALGIHIWKEKEYSDWALDQLIRRIRKKLIQLGIDKQTVKTHKYIGYSYGT